MVITKSENVKKQGFCKILEQKLSLQEGLLLSLIEFVWEGVEWGWALINFFCL